MNHMAGKMLRVFITGVAGAAVALLSLGFAHAEPADAATERLELDALVAEMLAANPELGAARKRWEAARQRPGQERSLPDPTVGVGWSAVGAPYPGAGLGTEMSANVGVTVSQMLPFPGKLGLKGGVAEQEARAEASLFTGAERALVARLKTAFYELQYVCEALDILDRNRALLERLSESARIRYESGEGAQQDLIKIQLEITLLETRAVELERQKRVSEAEINTLLARAAAAPLGRPAPPPELSSMPELPALEALQEAAMLSAPALRAQRSVIDGRQLGLELARRDAYPDFEVMGGYFNQGSMKDMWEFQVQMNLPIFSMDRRRLAEAEAAARLGEAQRAYRAREQEIGFQLRDRHLEAENARKLMELYSVRVLPQAALALESSLLNYGAGKLDFLSVFMNFTAILENETSYARSRAQYLQALARLEELSGM